MRHLNKTKEIAEIVSEMMKNIPSVFCLKFFIGIICSNEKEMEIL